MWDFVIIPIQILKLMKKTLFSLILTCIHLVCFSQIEDTVFPNPIGYTSDFEKIFAAKQINELDSLIIDFEKNTSNEIAIITVDNKNEQEIVSEILSKLA